MSNRVFVIGAGASAEVGLPTGDALKNDISDILNLRFDNGDNLNQGDRLIYATLRQFSYTQPEENRNFSAHIQACRSISNALPLAISIDNFIDSHRNDENIAFCGKLAIVRSILQAERNSNLYFDRSNFYNRLNFKSVEKTWFNSLFKMLTEGCVFTDLQHRFSNITFIIFNYDRCVEHFLFHAIKDYYGVSDQEVCELLSVLNFYHPYGSIAKLPWSRERDNIEFGFEPNWQQLINSAKRIRTFTEGTDPESSEVNEIKTSLAIADTAIFIGFAFHELNLELLLSRGTPELPETPINCFSTTYGFSEPDQEIIMERISALFERDTEINNRSLKCYEFFNEFKRTLAIHGLR